MPRAVTEDCASRDPKKVEPDKATFVAWSGALCSTVPVIPQYCPKPCPAAAASRVGYGAPSSGARWA